MKSLDKILAEHPFLEGVKAEHIEILTKLATAVVFYPGDFIFRQGQQADLFYLIDRGKVAVEAFSASGGPVVIQTLEAGHILGWSWLLPPYQWRFDARSLEFTTAIGLDGKVLRASLEEDHDLGYELLKRFLAVLALRLEATRLKLVEFYAAHS